MYTAPFYSDKSFFAGRNTSNAWLGRPNAALYGLRGDTVRAAGLPCSPAAACSTDRAQAGLKLTNMSCWRPSQGCSYHCGGRSQ